MNHTDFPADRVLSTRQLVGAMRRSVANGQRFCFILGSGISAESGIPTGQTLATRWMACLMGEQPDLDGTPPYPNLAEVEETAAKLRAVEKLQYDFEKIKALWAEYRGKPGWEMPSEYYFDLFKIRFSPWQQDGFYYLEQQMEGKEPSFGYHPLALMLAGGHSLAITTNFDSLLEDALYLYTDSKPLVINHEVLADYISRQQLSRPIIAKVHRGLFFDPLNSTEDTSGLRGQWQGELKAAFHTYTPIVIGYGGGDHSLMDFLRQPDTRMPRGLYWCYRESSGLPKNPIRQMVEDKGGHFVSTAGFDALMLAIGNALYPDKILAHKTAEHLQARTDLRIRQYEKTLENAKETAHTQSGAENADFQAQVQALDQREQEGEARRESQGQLTPWDHIRRGSRYHDAGAYTEAVAEYTQAIALDPKNAAAYNNRGIAYRNLGKYAEAIADYTQAITLDPKYAVAYNNRGAAYDDLGKYAEAIADYTQAIALAPKLAAAYNNRGLAYRNLGKYAEAIADYTQAIALDPKYAAAYNNRGLARYYLKQYPAAVEDFTKAIELDPTWADAFANRAEAYRALGQEDNAKADEEQAKKLGGQNSSALG